MDIDLAIERLLATTYISVHPEILNSYFSSSKMGPISGFFTIPYVIDYGVIITGTTVCIFIIEFLSFTVDYNANK